MRGLQLSAALCAAALLAGGWGAGKKEAAERVVKVVVMQPVKMEFVQKIRVPGQRRNEGEGRGVEPHQRHARPHEGG